MGRAPQIFIKRGRILRHYFTYNHKHRSFSVTIGWELSYKLVKEGWNVRYLAEREGRQLQPYLRINIGPQFDEEYFIDYERGDIVNVFVRPYERKLLGGIGGHLSGMTKAPVMPKVPIRSDNG